MSQYNELLQGLNGTVWTSAPEQPLHMPPPMPLLVIQWAMHLTQEQHRAIDAVIGKCLEGSGWKCVIVDAMDTSCVTAYMPNGGNMEALSIEDIVSRIKGVDETHNEAI